MNDPRPDNASIHAQSMMDRALHQLGSTEPDPGMNDRILRRIRNESAQPASHSMFFQWPRVAFATLAGCCLCTAIIVGSIQHSHAVAAQNHPVVPILQQQSGIATASSARIAAHPAVAPKNGGRSNEHPGQGRATVKPGTHVHGGDGIAVPPVR